jgi:hypothetical protein
MKIPYLLTLLSLSWALIHAPAARAEDSPKGSNYVIFCSPSIPEAKREQLFKEFSYFALGGTGKGNDAEFGMKPNDTLQLFDAWTLQSLLPRTFVMPAAAKTPKSRFKATEEVRAAFGKFLKEKPADDQPVDIPKLISCYKQMVDAPGARVLIIGSPLYHDDVPGHDMRQGWLSDGYFKQPLSVTAFSTEGRENSLRGNKFFFCTVSDDIYGTENKNAHMEGVKRFWTLFFNQSGGKLVGYQADINSGFANLTKDDLNELGPYKIDPEDKSMVVRKNKPTLQQETRSSPPATSINKETEAQKATTESLQNTISQGDTSAPDITSSEYDWLTKDPATWNPERDGAKLKNKNTRLGLLWKTGPENGKDADLDIYVKPKGAPDELYYNNRTTSSGVHYKDFSNPNASNGYELVNLNSNIAPEDLDIWVNAFNGTSPKGFSGEVRILYLGKLIAIPFTIPATNGNHGKSANTRNTSKNWVQVSSSQKTTPASSVPSKSSAAQRTSSGEYILVAGDNLYMVAEKFGVAFEDLRIINGISDPRNLKVGQKIKIPQTSLKNN